MKIPISRTALASMTLDEYRVHYAEVTSEEVLEAMYDDRLVAYDEQVAISKQLVDELVAEEVVADMDEACPLCGGPQQILGQLGQRVHLRCRNCGADTNEAIS